MAYDGPNYLPEGPTTDWTVAHGWLPEAGSSAVPAPSEGGAAGTGRGESPDLEAILARATSPHAEFGLRIPPQLPSAEVYEAALALDAVMIRSTGKREIALDAVVPISSLQTPEEMANWAASEAERVDVAARRGVKLGKDPRDMKPEPVKAFTEVEAETDSEDAEPTVEAVSIHGLPTKSTAEELALAERMLQSHSTYVHPGNKRHWL